MKFIFPNPMSVFWLFFKFFIIKQIINMNREQAKKKRNERKLDKRKNKHYCMKLTKDG